MGCDKYVEWMSAALDGELTAEERRELDSHLAVCPDCAQLFETLSRNTQAMRELDCQFPTDLHDRIMSNLPAQEAPSQKSRVLRWKRWGSLAACLVLVVALGTYARFGLRMGSMAPAAEVAYQPANQEAPAGYSAEERSQDGSSAGVTGNGSVSADHSDVSTENYESHSYSVEDKKINLSFNHTYTVRVGMGSEELDAPSATVVTSADTLDDYLVQIFSPFMDDSGAVPIPGLEKLTETYADAYFADHSLLLVLIREGSGSISHEIVSVSADTVTVRRIVPEAGTCDMAEWLLVIELDTMLDDNSVLAIEFEN